jgi:hypothetical protein
MDVTNPVLTAEVNRCTLEERIARASEAKLPASTHRHLLAQRLHRFAERIDN